MVKGRGVTYVGDKGIMAEKQLQRDSRAS